MVGKIVVLRAFVDRIEIAYQDRLVARHPRLYEPFSPPPPKEGLPVLSQWAPDLGRYNQLLG